jgi:Putative Actinobacterial Holin-X, holin superfamily III
MAEQLKYNSLPAAFSDVVTDLANLIQKEIGLARAELSQKLSISLRAGAWMSGAALLAVVAGLLVVQACVFGLAVATGFALHWSSLIVAAVLAAAGGAAFAKGKADVPDQLAPDRALNQVKQDIAVAQEQFT